MRSLVNRLLQEALEIHLGTPVRYVEGSEHKFVADFSPRALARMTAVFGEPVWINPRHRQEVVFFVTPEILLLLN